MLRLIFIFLLILAHSVSYGKKYTLSETPNGLCLKQWLGKDSVIDFNSHKELKKVKIIGEMAFEKNNHIKKVILPAQLKIIEKRAFNTCEKLEQVKIPPSVTYIGNSAFNMDRNLLLASLPDSLTEIGEWAFWDCNKVSISTIPHLLAVKVSQL